MTRVRAAALLALTGAVALATWTAVSIAGGTGRGARRADCHRGAPPLLRDGFPEPPVLYSRRGALEVTLRGSVGEVRFDHRRVTAMNYDGSVPGPTLAICAGDKLTVHLENDLDEPTNLHTHGFHVSPSDNHDNVFLRLAPHQTFTYEYEIAHDQPAGSYWYHPHVHMFVERQVFGGLAGAIVQEGGLDDLPALRHIPQRWIVLQNTELRGNAIVPIERATEAAARIYVNGVLDPTAKIRPGQLQRWRIFNASADRLIVLRLPLHQRFMLLAEDGHTLEHGRWVRDLLIAPGERRDVLVKGTRPGRYPLKAIPFAQFPGGEKAINGGPTPNQTVLTLHSSGAHVHRALPSGPLSHPIDLRRRHVDRDRTVVFSEMTEPSGKPLFALNGMTFDPSRTDVVMKLGSVERWTLVNTTPEWHTFHIHTNDFQVVSVNGAPVPYVDHQDNVALPPKARVVVLINPTDFTGRFVFHCHVTDHEDHGMMATVEVVRAPTAAQTRRSVVHDGAVAIGSSAYGARSVPAVTAPLFFCAPRHVAALHARAEA